MGAGAGHLNGERLQQLALPTIVAGGTLVVGAVHVGGDRGGLTIAEPLDGDLVEQLDGAVVDDPPLGHLGGALDRAAHLRRFRRRATPVEPTAGVLTHGRFQAVLPGDLPLSVRVGAERAHLVRAGTGHVLGERREHLAGLAVLVAFGEGVVDVEVAVDLGGQRGRLALVEVRRHHVEDLVDVVGDDLRFRHLRLGFDRLADGEGLGRVAAGVAPLAGDRTVAFDRAGHGVEERHLAFRSCRDRERSDHDRVDLTCCASAGDRHGDRLTDQVLRGTCVGGESVLERELLGGVREQLGGDLSGLALS